MAERDQMGGDTVDAAIYTVIDNKKKITPKSKEKIRNDSVLMQTSSSVRAEPTVQISDDDWKYKDFPSVGVCMIINIKKFHPSSGLTLRNGTDKDADAAKKTFGDLGYEVIVHKDLTKEQMETELKNVSTKDHSRNTSFVCVILSHGNEDGIYGTDRLLTLNDLTFYFKGDRCKSLIGKPKLFFLQACRGSKLDSGTTTGETVDAVVLPTPKKIPVEADFLYAFATAPGYYAWRNETIGSWFIHSLCEIISKHKDLELMHIMTRVNRKVACGFKSITNSNEFNNCLEIPCITSMLTKEFYFPKNA